MEELSVIKIILQLYILFRRDINQDNIAIIKVDSMLIKLPLEIIISYQRKHFKMYLPSIMGTTLLTQDLMGAPVPLIQGALVFVSEQEEYTSPLQYEIEMKNSRKARKVNILYPIMLHLLWYFADSLTQSLLIYVSKESN